MDKFVKRKRLETKQDKELVENHEKPSKVKKLSEYKDLKKVTDYLEDKDWRAIFERETQKPYYDKIIKFLEDEVKAKETIYPPPDDVYSIFQLCPFKQVKVVVIGQDPYHGPNQAHGLSFSVKKGIQVPPSLKNIYKEIKRDTGKFDIPSHGYLESWAKQGVFLLNTLLTVRHKKPASHKGKKCGWEKLTTQVLKTLNEKRDNLVFLLWGAKAQKAASFVDRKRHLVLETSHPSGLSVYRGFDGCGHFSKTNEYLKKHGIKPIDWNHLP